MYSLMMALALILSANSCVVQDVLKVPGIEEVAEEVLEELIEDITGEDVEIELGNG